MDGGNEETEDIVEIFSVCEKVKLISHNQPNSPVEE